MTGELKIHITPDHPKVEGRDLVGVSVVSPFSAGYYGSFEYSTESPLMLGEMDDWRGVRQKIYDLQNSPSPAAQVLQAATVEAGVEEKLFDATASIKVLISQVAMHMDASWRDGLFRQLDSLHDPQEWDIEDIPIQKGSFGTFLKAMLNLAPTVKPGLGASYRGYVVAAWTRDQDRLTVEFYPSDRVRWVISNLTEYGIERFAGEVPVSRLAETLQPYEPKRWLQKC
ncbi:MAG: hypothetical protein ACYCTF_12235 [Acidiferrobacter sp.]